MPRISFLLAFFFATQLLFAGQDETVAKFGTTVFDPLGLRGEIFYIRSNSKSLPKFQKLKPVGTIYTDSLNIPQRNFTEGFPGITDRSEWFAIDYTGRFWVQKAGKYRFSLLSDDGSKLYIDDRTIIDNDGLHPPRALEAEVELTNGLHTIRVPYFQGPRTQLALILVVMFPEETAWRVFSTKDFRPPTEEEAK